MKLLLNQGLPRSAAEILRSRGYDAVHTGEIGYATADDTEIMVHALRERRIIFTLDADFHALLAISGAAGPSVVRIRIERLRAPALADLVLMLLEHWGMLLEGGAVLTVLPDRVRVHHLPIGRA
jgi:predicted nuclease of predicted toxin-antitoxin system